MLKILLLDNFDSFTYNLADYLQQLGAEVVVLRNNVTLDLITTQIYDGIVLSPGPGVPQAAGCLMDIIIHYERKIPILGVCLGHQALGLHFGAKLCKANKPMHGKISTIAVNTTDVLFKDLSAQLNVVRYHSLILKELPETLAISAQTANSEIMAFSHKLLPISGIQFHPEAILTEYGLEMLANWLRQVRNLAGKNTM